MATQGMQDQSQQQPQPGAPQQGAPDAGGGQPSQAPAPPELMFLSQTIEQLKQLSQHAPAMSAGLAKAISGMTEAMSGFVSQSQPQSPQQTPPY
jgi:hypothetical protein